jgi:Rieske Fe-S protein
MCLPWSLAVAHVKWRGKPVFIRNRTEKEVEEAQAVAG